MPMYGQDMTKVAKWGDVAPEGWYHVRVDKVKCVDETGEQLVSKESSEPICHVFLKVQNEPHVGRIIWDAPSLQPHALAKLKAYYDAAGYVPGPEGHDPERIQGAEFFVKVDHEVYKGEKRSKIAPYNIRSLQEGPKGPLAQ